METLNMLIDNIDPENATQADTVLETQKAMFKVLKSWRDMQRMGQSVKFDFNGFESAIAKSMWIDAK